MKGFVFNGKKIDIPSAYIKKAKVLGPSLILEDESGEKTTFKVKEVKVDKDLSGSSANAIANNIVTQHITSLNDRVSQNSSRIQQIPDETEEKISNRLVEYSNSEQRFEAKKSFRTIGVLGREIEKTEEVTYPLSSCSIETIGDYGFALNDAGYYESQNKGIDASFAMCKVNFVMDYVGDIEFEVISFSEAGFDYGTFSNVGQELEHSFGQDSEFYETFRNLHSEEPTTLVYHDVPVGENFITIKYVKDGSASVGNDSFQFKLKTKIGTVTETWTETIVNDIVSNEQDKLVYNGEIVVTENVANDKYATKDEIPSLEGFATEAYVKNEIANAQLGGEGGDIDLSGYATKDELNLKADKTQLADYVTNEALNDKGYLTSVPSEYKTKAENDTLYQEKGNYISQELDPTVPDVVKNITESDISSWNNKSNFSGDYNDLENKPTIPSIAGLASESYVDSAISNKADKSDIPVNTSQLTNDSGFLTNYEETDPSVPDFVKNITQENINTWNNKSEFSGNYNDLTNRPTIPSVEGLASETYVNNAVSDKATTSYVDTKVANLINSAPETLDTLGEIAVAVKENQDVIDTLNSAIGNKANKADLNTTNSNVSELATQVSELDTNKADKTQLFSGSYNDLSNKPNIPSKTSDLTNDSGFITEYTETDPTVPSWAKNPSKPVYKYSEITERPTLSNVATSGSYNDLSDKPSIPSISGLASTTYVDNAVSDKANKSEIPDISGLASKNEIPTNNNQLENGAGYITSSALSGFATASSLNELAQTVQNNLSDFVAEATIQGGPVRSYYALWKLEIPTSSGPTIKMIGGVSPKEEGNKTFYFRMNSATGTDVFNTQCIYFAGTGLRSETTAYAWQYGIFTGKSSGTMIQVGTGSVWIAIGY